MSAVEERILVISKTYPECSSKYGCLVCVAGINKDGEWRRLYPIPFELFYQKDLQISKFKKWDTISVRVKRAEHDRRGESYRVLDPRAIQIVDSMTDWEERRRMARDHLDSGFPMLEKEDRSLGIIRPAKVTDFVMKPRSRIRDKGEREVLENTIQTLLPEFPETRPKRRLRAASMPWLGYEFMCEDESCETVHRMMCIDWEIQELYRRLMMKDKESAFEKTRDKALWMLDRDLYFCVGTTWRFGSWMTISLIYPPSA